jgi:chaperonin GroEL
MAKQILSSQEARKKIKSGMNQLADVVKATLGPKGRNIIIEKEWGETIATQDGVTVAQSIDLKDRFENVGAQLVKTVAIRTNDSAGDGTTTAVVLAQAMVEEGLKYSELGVSALGIRKGMKRAIKEIIDNLVKLSIEIKDKSQMKQVAVISAKDEEIGTIVSDIMDKVGKSGVISVEKSQTNSIEQEIVEGFRFDKGFISPYMVTDKQKAIAELDDSYILITDKSISNIDSILPIMEELVKAGVKQLTVISGDVTGDALVTLIYNTIKGGYKSLAIKAPYYGDKQKQSLEDIAILTGGTVITQDVGLDLKDVKIEHLGRARKIISSKDYTTIIEGKGDKKAIKERIKEIETQIQEEKSDYLKEILRERLGRLSGVVGIIKVGANSEPEQKDLELRIEDAISATQAALEEGIVNGGGLALIKARDIATADKHEFSSSEEEKGWEIVMKAIEKPFYQILINAGEKPDVILARIKEYWKEKNIKTDGFDANAGEYVNMLSSGIIDPKKVVRCALENASSIAEMFLSTEGIICMEDEKVEKTN